MANENNTNDHARMHTEFYEVWGNPRGWRALTIVNHTTVGIRFMITGGIFFILGGLLAMLMRTQLALPEQQLIKPDIYNQLFTMHGTIMMFLFAVPFIQGLALYLIPKMIGARDLVFPRLSAFGYFCYLFGGIILIISLLLNLAPDTGWFMYTPLTSTAYSPGRNADFWLIGITFAEISALATGIELVVSILRTRTANMALHQMPLFCWYILVMAWMIIFGFPPLILGSVLLELERAAGLPFFDVSRGGDPILWQHLFWLFGHPDVYIMFLPAAGIISTLIPVFARRPIVGYRWIVLAVIVTGFISFGLWVHHMFTIGIPQLAQAFFSVASMLVAIPTGIQLFAWLATLIAGRPVFRIPMLWVFGFLVIFVAGGLTGVMLALVPFNWQVHDTQFVVAHFHYVLIGGMFFPMVAGLYYWLPHFSGRMPSERLASLGFWLTFIGFNITFLIMHLTGLLGMPRRIYTYETGLGWDWPNLISSVGSFIMAAGIAMIILDILLHFRFGRPASTNPWNADTLEWATATPPQPYNFISLPACPTRHPLWDKPNLQQTIAAGEHDLAIASHGRRETWGTDPVTGKIREIIHLPGNSWLPFFASLAIMILCLSLIVRNYLWAAIFTLVCFTILLRWAWINGMHEKAAPETKIRSHNLPLHSRTFDGPGFWGMAVSLLANGAFYMSLVFGWFYLWTAAPYWQTPQQMPFSRILLLNSGLLLSINVLWLYRLMKRVRARQVAHLQANLWGIGFLGLIHCVILLWVIINSSLNPTQIAHDAVIEVILLYQLIHGVIAVIITFQLALRVFYGYIGTQSLYEPVVVEQWWIYTAIVFWLTYAAIVLLPMSWGGA
ncbi:MULTISPECIES: cytochrome c oxidase subunit I [unclassified Legionella]|uniref:cytochrome c oxidase subunit I n=1 Tax=unclassified Legionella TaxID=2622702 RepID=UPI0010552444|nr:MULTISPECIES: cytochrome c oxidase subunit I [unclassified Legionella]MDI9817585.1 cytochrome c oxidase subunit I [Legionella sp. PL877]